MSVLKEMIDLLDEERQTLISGKYAMLEDLAARKQAMAERLEQNPVSDNPDDYARLAAAAGRNAELIAAARRGFEHARAEISEMRKGMSQATYARDGSRHPLSRPMTKVEQKL